MSEDCTVLSVPVHAQCKCSGTGLYYLHSCCRLSPVLIHHYCCYCSNKLDHLQFYLGPQLSVTSLLLLLLHHLEFGTRDAALPGPGDVGKELPEWRKRQCPAAPAVVNICRSRSPAYLYLYYCRTYDITDIKAVWREDLALRVHKTTFESPRENHPRH